MELRKLFGAAAFLHSRGALAHAGVRPEQVAEAAIKIEHLVGGGRRNALDVVVEAIVAGLGLSVGPLRERGYVHRRELHDQVGISPVSETHDQKQIQEPPEPESAERE